MDSPSTELLSQSGAASRELGPGPTALPPRRRRTWGNTVSTGAIVVMLVVGTYALYHLDSGSEGKAEPTQRFESELTAQMQIPTELLTYRERLRIPVSLEQPVALAVGPDGKILVAGDSALEVLSGDGRSLAVVPLEGPPSCLAVAGPDDAEPGSVVVAVQRHITVLGPNYEPRQQWPDLEQKTAITAVVVAGDFVFVADAGQRVVWQYDRAGRRLGSIGKGDPDRQMPGFIIPSPCFDLVADADETLHIVNPGMRRIETYSFDGQLQSYWGNAGAALSDFFGCCNPAHLASLADGRFVTSEKGIPRIKIYSATGDLEEVVAGPEQLGVSAAALGDARGNQQERVFDVTADGEGNVLVLDGQQRCVVVFQHKTNPTETNP